MAHIWEACKQHDGHVWSVVDFRHFTVRERYFTRSQSVCLDMSEALRGGRRPRGAFLVQKNDLDLLTLLPCYTPVLSSGFSIVGLGIVKPELREVKNQGCTLKHSVHSA